MSNFIKLNNILNSKKKILKIFDKYKFSTNDIYEINDINLLFIYLCKIPNINNLIIKNCIENNKELNFNSTDKLDNNAFKYILNNFNQLNDKSKINDIMNNISTIKHFVNHISNDEINSLITLIYDKSRIYINDKSIYSLFKSLLIFCNKLNGQNNNDNKNFKNILNELQNTTNIRRIGYYVNKISKYISYPYKIYFCIFVNVFQYEFSPCEKGKK